MKDYTLDTEFDLFIENGDFNLSNSEGQAISLLFLTGKGHWKDSANTGIALEQFVNSNEKNTAITQIRFGLESDGATVKSLKFINDKINLDAVWTIS